jgi:hypothetical protein
MLNRLKSFSGKLVGKSLEQVEPLLFEFKYIPNSEH